MLGTDDEGPGGETIFRESLSPESVAAVAAVPGVANAEGVTGGFAKVVVDGQAVGTGTHPDIGWSWITDPALNPFTLASGAAPVANGDVVIDRALASQAGLQIGDEVEIITPTGVHHLTLTGTTDYGSAAGAPFQRTVHFAPEAANELLQADRLAQIVVRAEPGVDSAALASDLEAAVPGSEAISGADYIARLQGTVTSPVPSSSCPASSWRARPWWAPPLQPAASSSGASAGPPGRSPLLTWLAIVGGRPRPRWP